MEVTLGIIKGVFSLWLSTTKFAPVMGTLNGNEYSRQLLGEALSSVSKSRIIQRDALCSNCVFLFFRWHQWNTSLHLNTPDFLTVLESFWAWHSVQTQDHYPARWVPYIYSNFHLRIFWLIIPEKYLINISCIPFNYLLNSLLISFLGILSQWHFFFLVMGVAKVCTSAFLFK